jgi:hypothetical protein
MRTFATVLMWFVIGLLLLWSIAALLIDGRPHVLRIPLALLFALIIVAILKYRRRLSAAPMCLGCFCLVLAWWLSLKPSNEENWQPDVDRTPWAEIDGDRVTIHNLRNCDYQSETVYSNCWSDRTVFLSQLRGGDIFITTWGVPGIGHPILSFQFGDNDHIAFSIEARYKVGQSYSTFLGFFRQYELIFVTADERDLIRLRTNYRKDEEVRLYHTRTLPKTAQAVFLTYIRYLNHLHTHPEWYNALTRNCTTAIERQIDADLEHPQPWAYQILLTGKLDELLYRRGRLVTDGFSFPELHERAHINDAARAADDAPDWSARIRAGRPGFSE